MKMRMGKLVIVVLVAVVIFVLISVRVTFGQEGQRARRPDAYYKEFQTRIERQIYKKTAQGELAIYIHFPEDWNAADKRPAIVFFFGGGWNAGTVEQFTNQAHYLASRGIVADYA
jgi:acetyl esterase/lipase